MAGEIKHAWSGTVLTVTSDSGTSSSNLKGEKGDMGPRGPQGPCGVIYTEDGIVLADNLATTDYVDTLIENIQVDVDLTGYATEQYVTEKIIEVNTGGSISLDGYATELYVRDSIKNIGKPQYLYEEIGLTHVYQEGTSVKYLNIPKAAINFDTSGATQYTFRFIFSDGYEQIMTTGFKKLSSTMFQNNVDYSATTERIGSLMLTTSNEINYGLGLVPGSNGNYFPGDFLTSIFINYADADLQYTQINAQAIPVDGVTIQINSKGKLYAVGSGSGEEVDLSNYYTKSEIDALLSSLSGEYASAEEVGY